MIHPIIDKYYSHNPYHARSSKFVQDKGLITNEKNGAGATPLASPGILGLNLNSSSNGVKGSNGSVNGSRGIVAI